MTMMDLFTGKNKTAEGVMRDLEKALHRKAGPVLRQYGVDSDSLLTPLKWQPIVLVIGNYSSGKSTFINELLGKEVQRTGQAPTDDCFTIITRQESGQDPIEVPGSTLVNDESLPFASLRRFGESLLSHVRMKRVDAPILENIAIIDTPGMLDSVTEKDRGYDYLGVVRELARLADLIILMFDPHKAGTIKETYQAIRSTLPDATGEDRVLYVLNRIDECDNITDLVRSYGTLCWNLSQMTGRKDIPRVYLTYAVSDATVDHGVSVWVSERDQLKDAVNSAPKMRLNHILHEVDRGIRELSLQAEAMSAFQKGFAVLLDRTTRNGLVAAVVAFLFGDIAAKYAIGFPSQTMLGSLFQGDFSIAVLTWPLAISLLVLAMVSVYIRRWRFPRYLQRSKTGIDTLISLETAYKRDLWKRVRVRVEETLAKRAWKEAITSHERNVRRLESFLEEDLAALYERIKRN